MGSESTGTGPSASCYSIKTLRGREYYYWEGQEGVTHEPTLCTHCSGMILHVSVGGSPVDSESSSSQNDHACDRQELDSAKFDYITEHVDACRIHKEEPPMTVHQLPAQLVQMKKSPWSPDDLAKFVRDLAAFYEDICDDDKSNAVACIKRQILGERGLHEDSDVYVRHILSGIGEHSDLRKLFAGVLLTEKGQESLRKRENDDFLGLKGSDRAKH